jgi:hypothetical protein
MGERLFRACALIGLVSMIVSCDRSLTLVEQTDLSADDACFGCHGDDGTAFTGILGQWERSVHAEVAAPGPIHCFTCHAPHERGDLSVRVTDPTVLASGESVDMGRGNLCGSCHHARNGVASVGNGDDPVEFSGAQWGAGDSPQTDIFAAENGYEYPPVPYFRGPHRTRIVDGCVECHFDAGNGVTLGGHTMRMRFSTAPDESLNVAACTPTGCHAGLGDFDHHDIQTDVGVLLGLLGDELMAAGLIDSDGRPIPGRVAGADSAGAVWNYRMVIADGSTGVHNPDYVLDLLGSSLIFMGGTLPAAQQTGPGREKCASIRSRRRLRD